MKNKINKTSWTIGFIIANILEMRFRDGTGSDLQVKLAHDEIMAEVDKALSQAREEGMIEGYSKGHDKGYIEGCNKLPASYQKGKKEGIEEFADWVWEGWNLDLAGKDRAVKHFLELKEKEGR